MFVRMELPGSSCENQEDLFLTLISPAVDSTDILVSTGHLIRCLEALWTSLGKVRTF